MDRAALLYDRLWRHDPRVVLQSGELKLEKPRQQSQRIFGFAKTFSNKRTIDFGETSTLKTCHFAT